MAEVAVRTNCGIDELYGLRRQTPLQILQDAFSKWNRETGYPPAFCFFSDVEGCDGGELAEFITERPFLGNIRPSSIRMNYNSGNNIQVWLWEFPNKRRTYLRRNAKRLGIKLKL